MMQLLMMSSVRQRSPQYGFVERRGFVDVKGEQRVGQAERWDGGDGGAVRSLIQPLTRGPKDSIEERSLNYFINLSATARASQHPLPELSVGEKDATHS